MSFPLGKPHRIIDFWRDEDLGVHEGSCRMDVAPHGARQLVVKEVE